MSPPRSRIREVGRGQPGGKVDRHRSLTAVGLGGTPPRLASCWRWLDRVGRVNGAWLTSCVRDLWARGRGARNGNWSCSCGSRCSSNSLLNSRSAPTDALRGRRRAGCQPSTSRTGRCGAASRQEWSANRILARLIHSGPMTTLPPRPIAVRTWARLAVLGGVVLGVVAMHGLSSHGMGPGSAPTMHAAGPSMSIASTASYGHASPTLSPDPGPGIGRAMAGLCVAVIGLGLGLVAMLTGRRRVPLTARRTASGWAVPSLRGRDRDPPSLIRLSIQRC
jgi:hypothetical protein